MVSPQMKRTWSLDAWKYAMLARLQKKAVATGSIPTMYIKKDTAQVSSPGVVGLTLAAAAKAEAKGKRATAKGEPAAKDKEPVSRESRQV